MKKRGFTIIELLVAMTVFVFVIAGASQVFTGLLSQFKEQSTIASTNTRKVAGLDILRRDIEQAGYGLPWTLGAVSTYNETIAESGMTPWVDRYYNDGPKSNLTHGYCGSSTPPCLALSQVCEPGNECLNPPSPFRSGDDLGISEPNGTVPYDHSTADLLVIKSATAAVTSASQKWTYIANNGSTDRVNTWNLSDNNPEDTDQVIVIYPSSKMNPLTPTGQTLQNDSGSFTESYKNLVQTVTSGSLTNGFVPGANTFTQYIVYDIAPHDPNGTIRMPFNRTDYFVKRITENSSGYSSAGGTPSRCAPNTGSLIKGVVSNTTASGGGIVVPYRILDCVADFQVVYLLDTDGDGKINWCPGNYSGCNDGASSGVYSVCAPNATTRPSKYLFTASPTGNIECMTESEIRSDVKEVRVYIVAQEGRRDPNYDFSQGGTRTSLSAEIDDPNPNDVNPPTYDVPLVNLKDLVGPDYIHYRWKLYTITVQPEDMQ